MDQIKEELWNYIQAVVLAFIAWASLSNFILIATLVYTLLNTYLLISKIKKERRDSKDGNSKTDSL